MHADTPKPGSSGTARRKGSRRPRRGGRSYPRAGAFAIAFACWFLAGIGARPSLAQDGYTRFRYEHSKIVTEEPFPVRAGAVEITAFHFYRTARSQFTDGGSVRSRGRFTQNLSLLSLTYGVTDGLDVGTALGYAKLVDPESEPPEGDGLTGLALFGTYLFYYDEEAELALGYLPAFLFPTGSQTDVEELGVSEEFYLFDNRIAIVKDWSDYWTSNLDFGYTWFFGEGAGVSNGVFSIAAAVGYQFEPWLQPVFEMLYVRDFVKSGGDLQRLSLLGGFVLPISDTLQVEIGALQAVAGSNAPQLTSIIANVSVTF